MFNTCASKQLWNCRIMRPREAGFSFSSMVFIFDSDDCERVYQNPTELPWNLWWQVTLLRDNHSFHITTPPPPLETVPFVFFLKMTPLPQPSLSPLPTPSVLPSGPSVKVRPRIRLVAFVPFTPLSCLCTMFTHCIRGGGEARSCVDRILRPPRGLHVNVVGPGSAQTGFEGTQCWSSDHRFRQRVLGVHNPHREEIVDARRLCWFFFHTLKKKKKNSTVPTCPGILVSI